MSEAALSAAKIARSSLDALTLELRRAHKETAGAMLAAVTYDIRTETSRGHAKECVRLIRLAEVLASEASACCSAIIVEIEGIHHVATQAKKNV